MGEKNFFILRKEREERERERQRRVLLHGHVEKKKKKKLSFFLRLLSLSLSSVFHFRFMFPISNALSLRRNIPDPCLSRSPIKLGQNKNKNLVRQGTKASTKKKVSTAAAPLAMPAAASPSPVMQALSAHWLAISGAAVCTFLVIRLLRFVRYVFF